MLVSKMILQIEVALIHLLAVGALCVFLFMVAFSMPFKDPPVCEHVPILTIRVLTLWSLPKPMLYILVDSCNTMIIVTKVAIGEGTNRSCLSQMDCPEMCLSSLITPKVLSTHCTFIPDA